MIRGSAKGARGEPVRITTSAAIPARYHGRVVELVRFGFAAVDATDVDVHIRSRPPLVCYLVRFNGPVGLLGEDARRQWLRDHPGTLVAPLAHFAQRRRDASDLTARFGGTIERQVNDQLAERMSGCAYYEMPRRARVAESTRYLVTLRLPQRLDDLSYPQVLQYRRAGVLMVSAPRIEVRAWPEELVHLAAHEARHIHQFRQALPKSEVDAEHWAAAAVRRLRASDTEGHDHLLSAVRSQASAGVEALARR
jgi:hypothetical protein